MITVNKTKLEEVIAELANEVGGYCSETCVTIGTTKGLKIVLFVSADEDDEHPETNPKWACVEGEPQD